jgi:hypothetical protein
LVRIGVRFKNGVRVVNEFSVKLKVRVTVINRETELRLKLVIDY